MTGRQCNSCKKEALWYCVVCHRLWCRDHARAIWIYGGQDGEKRVGLGACPSCETHSMEYGLEFVPMKPWEEGDKDRNGEKLEILRYQNGEDDGE